MHEYEWIWQNPSWTDFEYDAKALEKYHTKFMFNAQNMLSGIVRCPKNDQEDFRERFEIEVTGIEAYYTSEIEGENIRQESIRSALHYEFSRLNEQAAYTSSAGISKMMADLFMNYAEPLTHDRLHSWNKLLTSQDKTLQKHGAYRTHEEDMVIMSGAFGKEKFDFIAPPSRDVPELMDGFIAWYADTAPNGKNPLPPLIRAGLAHLYFVTIHPYEDGNGRASRAIAEKALSEYMDKPTLISLSHAISNSKKEYYAHLKNAQKYGLIQPWLEYFCETILEAQNLTRTKLKQAIVRKELEEQVMPTMSETQIRAVRKMVDCLSERDANDRTYDLKKYIKLSKQINPDRAEAELKDLVKRGILVPCENKTDRWKLNTQDTYDQGCRSLRRKVSPAKQNTPEHEMS